MEQKIAVTIFINNRRGSTPIFTTWQIYTYSCGGFVILGNVQIALPSTLSSRPLYHLAGTGITLNGSQLLLDQATNERTTDGDGGRAGGNPIPPWDQTDDDEGPTGATH